MQNLDVWTLSYSILHLNLHLVKYYTRNIPIYRDYISSTKFLFLNIDLFTTSTSIRNYYLKITSPTQFKLSYVLQFFTNFQFFDFRMIFSFPLLKNPRRVNDRLNKTRETHPLTFDKILYKKYSNIETIYILKNSYF